MIMLEHYADKRKTVANTEAAPGLNMRHSMAALILKLRGERRCSSHCRLGCHQRNKTYSSRDFDVDIIQ